MSDATRALVTFDQAASPAARSQPRVRNSPADSETRADDSNGFKQAMKDQASKSHTNAHHDNKTGNTDKVDSGRAVAKGDGSSSDKVSEIVGQEEANAVVGEHVLEPLGEHSIAVTPAQQAVALSALPEAGFIAPNDGLLPPVSTAMPAGQGHATVLSSAESAPQMPRLASTAAQPNGMFQTVSSNAQPAQAEQAANAAISLSSAVARASGDLAGTGVVNGLAVALSPPKMGAAGTGTLMAAGASGKHGGSLTQSMLNQLTMRSVNTQVTPSAAREPDKSFASYVEALAVEGQESTDHKPLTAQLEGSASKAPLPATDRVFVSVNAKFGSPGWAEQLAERSANLASQNIKHAEIQLNPQDMGPIHIKISMTNDQAAVTFAAQNAAVREALDASMQRLKDAFDADGLELVQSDVKDQQQSSDQESSQGGQGRGETASDNDDAAMNRVAIHVPRSAVDHFV